MFFTGYWHGGAITHTVDAANGDDAWNQLIRWANSRHIQNPTQFTMFKKVKQ